MIKCHCCNTRMLCINDYDLITGGRFEIFLCPKCKSKTTVTKDSDGHIEDLQFTKNYTPTDSDIRLLNYAIERNNKI